MNTITDYEISKLPQPPIEWIYFSSNDFKAELKKKKIMKKKKKKLRYDNNTYIKNFINSTDIEKAIHDIIYKYFVYGWNDKNNPNWIKNDDIKKLNISEDERIVLLNLNKITYKENALKKIVKTYQHLKD